MKTFFSLLLLGGAGAVLWLALFSWQGNAGYTV